MRDKFGNLGGQEIGELEFSGQVIVHRICVKGRRIILLKPHVSANIRRKGGKNVTGNVRYFVPSNGSDSACDPSEQSRQQGPCPHNAGDLVSSVKPTCGMIEH
ncbi:hypothetical protein AVEN_16823-1 [Araneus ventricosus]|uniref:Uncharacterized protein n=1 Tax=Araneus ventricosus TaxID=182803 RepID=A0A4Y2BSM1_ARAVE|nr:hypothetical protein AVEN_16823-1 [Araneus ventricosus]